MMVIMTESHFFFAVEIILILSKILAMAWSSDNGIDTQIELVENIHWISIKNKNSVQINLSSGPRVWKALFDVRSILLIFVRCSFGSEKSEPNRTEPKPNIFGSFNALAAGKASLKSAYMCLIVDPLFRLLQCRLQGQKSWIQSFNTNSFS